MLQNGSDSAHCQSDAIDPQQSHANRHPVIRVGSTVLRRKVICPNCPAPFFKKFCFSEIANQPTSSAVSPHQKGRIADVTDAGRDAVDAAASGVRWSQGGLLP